MNMYTREYIVKRIISSNIKCLIILELDLGILHNYYNWLKILKRTLVKVTEQENNKLKNSTQTEAQRACVGQLLVHTAILTARAPNKVPKQCMTVPRVNSRAVHIMAEVHRPSQLSLPYPLPVLRA